MEHDRREPALGSEGARELDERRAQLDAMVDRMRTDERRDHRGEVPRPAADVEEAQPWLEIETLDAARVDARRR